LSPLTAPRRVPTRKPGGSGPQHRASQPPGGLLRRV